MNPSHNKKSLKQCSPLSGLQEKARQRLASLAVLLTVFLGLTHLTHAQWQTQSITLEPGWNAVYLHVDASHYGVADVTPAPIDEIWLWNRISSGDRFMTDPATPSPSQDWASWNRIPLASDTLGKLIGNAAYLVRNSSGSDYEWKIKGKPLPPTVASYGWTSRGVNLIGFSTPETAPPMFSDYLLPVQRLADRGEFYRYDDGDQDPGGDQDLTPTRFDALFGSVTVDRGHAYWVRHEGEFNRYFGPFEVVLGDPTGIHFGDSLLRSSLRVRNHTDAELTVDLSLLASEEAPVGEEDIDETKVPLLLRGDMNTTNLTFAAETFEAPRQITLAPKGQSGSEVELILGVDRSQMGNDTGTLYAGILRLSDTLGLAQMDLGVSAQPASDEGLWVGTAVVNQVGHYLKQYEEDAQGAVTLNGDGTYKVESIKTDLGMVSQPAQLRLILHHGTYTNNVSGTRLMQRVFHGLNTQEEEILTTTQAALDSDQLASARRISAVHLPFTQENTFWDFTGDFAPGQSMTAVVTLGYTDHQSNPFLHTYHPDHDNLDPLYEKEQDRGLESYDLERSITLEFTASGEDFASRVSGEQQRSGIYTETITLKGSGSVQGNDEETFELKTSGGFSINRISSIEALTAAP